jgi:hypothetical protein
MVQAGADGKRRRLVLRSTQPLPRNHQKDKGKKNNNEKRVTWEYIISAKMLKSSFSLHCWMKKEIL